MCLPSLAAGQFTLLPNIVQAFISPQVLPLPNSTGQSGLVSKASDSKDH